MPLLPSSRHVAIALLTATALAIPAQLAAQPATSGTGQVVAFVTKADLGLGGPPAGLQAIYVKNRLTGDLALVAQCKCSGPPSLSLNGTRVAFRVDGPDGSSAAYVIDAPFDGQPVRVDTSDAGPASGGTLTGGPILSGNGRFVAFASTANLDAAAAETPGTPDLFVRDLQTGRTERWTTGAQVSSAPSITADGRFVAFATSSQLAAGDANTAGDVYVIDRVRPASAPRLLTPSGLNVEASDAMIAAGGSAVAFTSAANGLVPGDSDGVRDVFVIDLRAGTTSRISMSTEGVGADAASHLVSISGNGRRVAFASTALASPDGATHLYVHDLTRGETLPVGAGADGAFDALRRLACWQRTDGRHCARRSPETTCWRTPCRPMSRPVRR